MVSPKGLKPKKYQEEKRQAQKLMGKEERKRKEAQVRRLKKKAEPGSSKTAKRLGILEACKYSQERIKTAQKKKSKRNTRNRGWACPSQVSSDPTRIGRKTWSDFS